MPWRVLGNYWIWNRRGNCNGARFVIRATSKEGQKKLEALKTANQAQRVEQYTEAFYDEKDATIMRLRNAQMGRLDPEEYFKAHDEKRLSESLQRTYGVSATEIAEHLHE